MDFDFDLLLADLDGTLYEDQLHVWELTCKALHQYMHDTLGLPIDLSLNEQRAMKKKWKTNHTILAYIHEYRLDFDTVANVLADGIASAQIRPRHGAETLEHLPVSKMILTNSPEMVAHVLLKKIGMSHLFDRVIGLERHFHSAKPHAKSYRRVPTQFKKIIMIDDLHSNLIVPYKRGWNTAWFPEDGQPSISPKPHHIHHEIRSLADLQHLRFRSP